MRRAKGWLLLVIAAALVVAALAARGPSSQEKLTRQDAQALPSRPPELLSAGPDRTQPHDASVADPLVTDSAEADVVLGGHVIDEWGQPVAGGSVGVRPLDEGRAGTTELPVSTSGAFQGRVATLQAPRLELRYAGPGLQAPAVIVEAGPGSSHADIQLVAFRVARIRIEARHADGRSAANARLEVLPRDTLRGSVLTDASGAAEVVLGSDPHTAIRVVAEDGWRGETQALYPQPGEVRTVRVVLAERWQRVPIRVVSAAPEPGAPPAVAHVEFMNALNVTLAPDVGGLPGMAELPADRSLRARVSLPGSRPYQIKWPDLASALSADGSLTIVAQAMATLRLTIESPDGMGVPRLPVSIRQEGQPSEAPVVLRAQTDAGGHAVVQGVAPGTYTVATLDVVLGVIRVVPPMAELRYVLESYSTLAGTYRGPRSIGWREASIRIEQGRRTVVALDEEAIGADGAWSASVPLPAGSEVTVRVVADSLELVPAQDVRTGSQGVLLSSSATAMRLHVRAGARRFVSGWIQLRPLSAPSKPTMNFAIDTRSSDIHLVRPEPGEYAIFHARTMFGQDARRAPSTLVVTADASTYVIDIGDV